MDRETKILWYAFPLSGIVAWLLYASLFAELWWSGFYFGILMFAAVFYISTLLFTIPVNIFSAIVFFLAWRKHRAENDDYKTFIAVGILNVCQSIVWAISVFVFDWVLVA